MKILSKIISLFTVVAIAACFILTPVSAANYKSSLSDYVGKGSLKLSETRLVSCDSMTSPKIESYTVSGVDISASIDTANKKEGSGSYSVTWNTAGEATFFRARDFGSYDCSPSDGKVTIKLWFYINDISKIDCDHSGFYNYDYSDSGTIFLRAETERDSNYYAVNQTVKGNGWQEIEFTFDHDNGIESGFDIHNVTGFWINVSALSPGLTIKIDNVRLCYYYNTGYSPDIGGIPNGAKVVSYCDYDGLCGDVVSEWFNSDFSSSIKKYGSSSLHLYSNASDDQRLFWGGLNISLNHSSDVLCFWVYIDNIDNISDWFIECNQIQDKTGYEFEYKNALSAIKKYSAGGLSSKTWVMVQFPLSVFSGSGTISMKHLRMVVTAKSGTELNVYIDNVSIASLTQLAEYNSQNHIAGEVNADGSDILIHIAGEDAASSADTGDTADEEISSSPSSSSSVPAAQLTDGSSVSTSGTSSQTAESESEKKSSKTGLLIGIVIAAAIVIPGTGGAALLLIVKRKKAARNPDNPDFDNKIRNGKVNNEAGGDMISETFGAPAENPNKTGEDAIFNAFSEITWDTVANQANESEISEPDNPFGV